MELLRGGVLLEEVGYCKWALRLYGLSPLCVFSLATPLQCVGENAVSQLPALAAMLSLLACLSCHDGLCALGIIS